MASIHRDSKGKSPFWQAAFTGPDGRRRLVSTKQTSKAKAMQTAVLWEHHAKRARQKLLTEAQGRKIIAEFVEFSTGQEMTFYSCREWLDEWTEKRTVEAAETTRARYKQISRDFLAFMGDRADLPLRTVNSGDILGFRDKLRKEGRAASTCNTVVRKILSMPFRLARELGYIEVNPASPAALGVQLKDKGTDTGREPFTPEEIKKLLRTAEGEWKGAILLAATTGLRLGDVTGLEWASVDLKKEVLTVKTTKTGKDVKLPMHPDFTAWLKKEIRGIGKAPVFPKLSKTRMNGENGLSELFMGIVSGAGIVQRTVEREGKGRATNSKTFHSLRHSFISMLANAGVSPELRQKLAAHEDSEVHEKYTHHESATLAAAIAKLPRLATK
jgi:integrase